MTSRASLQLTVDGESRQIVRRIVACICDRILNRLFVTLACANHRTISDTQPGRERPRNRPWGHGRGSGGGVAHVPAALRGIVRVGRNRRRAVIELAGVVTANSRRVFGYAYAPRLRSR